MDYSSGFQSGHCQRGKAYWRRRSSYRTSGCPPWRVTPRVSCTPSSWTGSRKRCESSRPGSRGTTMAPGASGSTQSVKPRGYWHFDPDNKYQPVKLAALLVSFCQRGSKHLKGVTFLDIGGKVWVIGHTQGPSLVLSTPTSLSTEGRRAGKVTIE